MKMSGVNCLYTLAITLDTSSGSPGGAWYPAHSPSLMSSATAPKFPLQHLGQPLLIFFYQVLSRFLVWSTGVPSLVVENQNLAN